jgi:hypothetical protein
MAKIRTNFIAPILREYWLGKQMYDDGVLRTIVDIYLESKTRQVIIEFDNGDVKKSFLKDYFDFELTEDIHPLTPNSERLKNKKR